MGARRGTVGPRPRHVMVWYGFGGDSDALAAAVDIAGAADARLTLAVPLVEPGGFSYSTPFPLDEVRDELGRDAQETVREALGLVPAGLPVVTRVLRRGEEIPALDHGPGGPVDLLISAEASVRPWRHKSGLRRLVRTARRRRVACLKVEGSA